MSIADSVNISMEPLIEVRDLPPDEAGQDRLTVKLWLLEKPEGAPARLAEEAA